MLFEFLHNSTILFSWWQIVKLESRGRNAIEEYRRTPVARYLPTVVMPRYPRRLKGQGHLNASLSRGGCSTLPPVERDKLVRFWTNHLYYSIACWCISQVWHGKMGWSHFGVFLSVLQAYDVLRFDHGVRILFSFAHSIMKLSERRTFVKLLQKG